MGKHYTPDFKLEAVKRVQRTGEPVSKVAEDLGINPNTLHGWMKGVREHPEGPFPGSGKLSPEDDDRLSSPGRFWRRGSRCLRKRSGNSRNDGIPVR